MRVTRVIGTGVMIGLLASWATPRGWTEETEGKGDELKAEAKISKKTAIQIVQAKVPHGKVKEAELEQEHGRLVWSMDIAVPHTDDILEVQVDAKTADVVAIEIESRDAQEKEAKAEHRGKEKKESKREKDDDDDKGAEK